MKFTVFCTIAKIFMSLYVVEMCPGDEAVVKRIENITKPVSDKRSYRGLHLSNGLKVLLISDESVKKAAASLVAGVGSLNDLVDVHGVVNLVGYSLILGHSSCQPPHQGLREFIRYECKGSLRMPFTKEHEQAFTFAVNSWSLQGALQKFAECFRAPHFVHARCGKILDIAINYVEAEFQTNSRNDFHRMTQVEKIFCKERNAYGNLFGGNRNTLLEKTGNSKKLLRRAIEFYHTWYSSNTMTLAVMGKQKLDELEKMVVPLFKTIENRGARKYQYKEENHPWRRNELGYRINIVPFSRDNHLLYITFPVPDVNDKYKTAPDGFIRDLLIFEYPGSLLSLLKMTDLALSAEINIKSTVGIAFFTISCPLTPKGVENVDAVITLILQFINLIREQGVQERIFHHCRRKRLLNFQKQYPLEGEEWMSAYAENLALFMQVYPMEDILAFNFIHDKWDPELIEQYLAHLTPKNMIVSFISETNKKKFTTREKYFGTKYSVEKIPDEFLDRWSRLEHVPRMRLPEPNDYIPENFDVYPIDPEDPQPHPYKIYESSKTEIWFKQDDIFRTPKVFIKFQVYSSIAELNPINQLLWCTTMQEMSHLLQRIFIPAETAFDIAFDFDTEKVEAKLMGFSDKAPLLLERILSTIANFKLDADEEHLMKSLQETARAMIDAKNDHIRQAQWYTFQAMIKDSSEYNEIDLMKWVRASNFKVPRPKLLRRMFIRAFIHGNCSKEKAMEMAHIFENAFQSSQGLLMQEFDNSRVVEIPEGHHVYQVFNEKHNVYAYSMQFQLDSDLLDSFNYVASGLIYEVVLPPCREVLSHLAQKKASKIHSKCEVITLGNVRWLLIELVTTKHPRYVEEKVEELMRDTCNSLNSMSRKAFEELKLVKGLKWKLRSENLEELSDLHFFEIDSRYFMFDRDEILMKELDSTKQEDVYTHCKEVLHPSSRRRRRLSIHVLPKNLRETKPTLLEPPQNAINIEDLQHFNNHSSFHPIILVREDSTSGPTGNNIAEPEELPAIESAGHSNKDGDMENSPPTNKRSNRTKPMKKQRKFHRKIVYAKETSEEDSTDTAHHPEQESPKTPSDGASEILKEDSEQKENIEDRPLHSSQTTMENLRDKMDEIESLPWRTSQSNPMIPRNITMHQEETAPIQIPSTAQTSPEQSPEIHAQGTTISEQIENVAVEQEEVFELTPDTNQTLLEITDQGGSLVQETPHIEQLMQLDLNIKQEQNVADHFVEASSDDLLKIDKQIEELQPSEISLISQMMSENLTGTTDEEIQNQKTDQGSEEEIKNKMLPEEDIPVSTSVNNLVISESLHSDTIEIDEATEPYIFHRSSISEFWFKQDMGFECPTMEIFLDVFCPVSRLHPSNFVMLSIFASLLESTITTNYEHRIILEETKCTIKTSKMDFKMEITLSGLPSRIPIMLTRLGTTITNMQNEIYEELFTDEKLKQINKWTAFDSEIHSTQREYHLKNILNQYAWTVPELTAAARILQFKHWEKFLRKLFSRIFIRGLILGNTDMEFAKAMAYTIERQFESSRGALPNEILVARTIQPEGSAYFTSVFHEEPDTYEYWAFFQFDSQSSLKMIANSLGLLIKLISEHSIAVNNDAFPAAVHCKILTEGNLEGLVLEFGVTMEKSITHAHMDTYAEKFLFQLHGTLKNLKLLDFYKFTAELQNELATNAMNAGSLFWKEISQQEYSFERREIMVDQLYFITREDLLRFFEETLAKCSPKRRKFVIYSFPEGLEEDSPRKIPTGAIEITDLTAFKSAAELLPLPTPWAENDIILELPED